MIRFVCPTCGRKIKAEDQYVGRKGKCPGCGNGFVVPAASDPAPPEQPVPAHAPKAGAPPRSLPPRASAAQPQVAAAATALPPSQPASPPAPGRMKWIAVAAGVLLVAGGAAAWYVYRSGNAPKAAPANRATAGGGLASVSAGAEDEPSEALPTEEDGRFVPGRIAPSARILKTFYVSPGGAMCEDGEQVFVSRIVDGKISMVLADQPPSQERRGSSTRPSVSIQNELGPWDFERMTPVLSSDSKRLAYVRPLGRSRAAVVLDGKQSPEYRSATSLTFSPDAKRCAYVAMLNNAPGSAVVVDGQEGKTYGRIFDVTDNRMGNRQVTYPIRFSPDSAHFAYGACVERDGSNTKALLVIDEEAKTLDTREIFDVTWAPDSRRIACVMTVPANGPSGYQFAVWLDGKKGKSYGAILHGSLRFSSDGSHLVYVAGTTPQGPFFVVDNEVEGKPLNFIFPDSLQFNPLGQLEYDAGVGKEPANSYVPPPYTMSSIHLGKPIHVIDGVESDGFRKMLTYSADGKHCAWATWRDNAMVVMQDGKPSQNGYGEIAFLQLSPDGTHCAFAAGERYSPSRLVIDGREVPLSIRGAIVRLRYLAPDTLRLLMAGDNEYRVVQVKLRPAPAPAVAGKLVRGSETSERTIADVRKIAAAANAVQRLDILAGIPFVYAQAGEKDAAIAAFDAFEAELAAAPRPAVDRNFPDGGLPIVDPARRDIRHSTLFCTLVGSLAGKGDKSGAAQLAADLAAEVLRNGAAQAGENQQMAENVAVAYSAIGDLPGLQKFISALQPPPRLRSSMLCLYAARLARLGDVDGAAKLAATLEDPAAVAGMYEQIGDAQAKKGDSAGAADSYTKSLLAMQSLPERPSEERVRLALLRTGGVAALRRVYQALPLERRREIAGVLTGGFQKMLASGDKTMAMEILNAIQPEDGEVGRYASRCADLSQMVYTDSASRKLLRAAAVKLGALNPRDCAPVMMFFSIAEAQQREQDNAGLAETAAQAAKAYRANPISAGLPQSANAQWLARIQLMAGDKAAAMATLKEAAQAATGQQLVLVVRLQAEVGDPAVAQSIQRIAEWASKLEQEPERTNALAQLADVQTVAGDLKAAFETLARCSPAAPRSGMPSQYNTPEMCYARLAAAQVVKGDKAGAETTWARAIEFGASDRSGSSLSLWGGMAGALADAGDPKGAVALLDREVDRPFRPEDVSAVAKALIKTGDLEGAGKVLIRIGRGGGYEYVNAVERLGGELARSGNYKAAFQLASLPGPMQGRPPQLGEAMAAAVEAGDLDLALSAMKTVDVMLLMRLAQVRLDKDDDGGAKRILERGLEIAAAEPGSSRKEHIKLIVNLLRDAEFDAEADQAEALLGENDPIGSPATRASLSGGSSATQPAASTQPSSFRTPGGYDPYGERFDMMADSRAIARMVRQGKLDEVLQWASAQSPARRRWAISETSRAVLYPESSAARNMGPESPGPHLKRRAQPSPGASGSN